MHRIWRCMYLTIHGNWYQVCNLKESCLFTFKSVPFFMVYIWYQTWECSFFFFYVFSFADSWSISMAHTSFYAMVKNVFLFALPWIALTYGMPLWMVHVMCVCVTVNAHWLSNLVNVDSMLSFILSYEEI